MTPLPRLQEKKLICNFTVNTIIHVKHIIIILSKAGGWNEQYITHDTDLLTSNSGARDCFGPIVTEKSCQRWKSAEFNYRWLIPLRSQTSTHEEVSRVGTFCLNETTKQNHGVKQTGDLGNRWTRIRHVFKSVNILSECFRLYRLFVEWQRQLVHYTTFSVNHFIFYIHRRSFLPFAVKD